ncbi:hypothetical protein M0813_24991 [Anaeramoeba flamelloides]|uniref:DDE-1 domain-containing protein n=1 Tax=Anaeramoeba flamelloides TaxID=1746091 RepID=A0ABQ8Y637_9EUKA|nr:hypothetical protein M0813_24991 [Anaeramoeba flamelloides]
MLKIDPNWKKINKEIILVFFQTYTHYIEENELTSDRIWCMDETPCQHSDTPKKSFKLRNSKSFSKTHGFNQRDTLVACIRADGARLAPMIIETRNAYLNKKDSSKSREKIGGMSEDFMIFWLEYFSQFTQKGDILILDNLSSHKTKLVIEKARKLFINLIFTPPKEAKRYSPLDNSFFGTFKRTRANCLPHMHNYTRILRLLIISKYYYDATGESVRGNFIKKWLGIMEERMYRKDRKCDFTDLKKLSEDDNFGLKHRKKYQNFIDQNESEKDEFFRVCTDIQMNNMKTNSQKGKKRVRNAGKTTLSQPIFTEERFEVRPQSKKKTTPPKKEEKGAKCWKKKRKNAGNDSQKKNDINKSPTKEGLKMTRSSKNDLQIDEDISLPFDINHLTNVCEKVRLEYTNKLVVVESSESDEIMVVSNEDDILEEWSEDANSDRSGDTKLSKVVLEDNIIGINWRDNLCWFDSVIHSLTFVEGFVDWLKAIDTNEAKMLRAMLVSIRNSTTISRRKSRELKNLLMSARDKLLKSAPQEYRNGDLNHVSSAIVILDAIFQKHPKYKGDMTSDYFRVYDKNICEGKTVVPLAPTVVYLKDKALLNDLPILKKNM